MGKKKVSLYTALGRWSRNFSWWLIIAMLVIAALLVIAGIVLIIIGKPEYHELLFKIAKILGAGGTAIGTLKAFWKQICEKIDLINLQHANGHVIICGLGDKGMRLMRTFTDTDKECRVVSIEAKQDHHDIPSCRQRGVLVLTGDASDKVMLDEANAGSAKYLFAVTGDDKTNIEIARQGKELSKASINSLRCYVHINNSSLRDIMAKHDLFAKSYDVFDASIINIYDTAARVVMEKYPPDRYARYIKPIAEAVRIIIIGFGKMGESIVKQAARIGHYYEWRKLEVTVVDRNAKGFEEKFFAVYGDGKTPNSFIVPDIHVQFVERDPECLVNIDEIIGQNNNKPAIVYIAMENDAIGASLSLRVRNMLDTDDIPIVICMQSSLSELMEGQSAHSISDRNIHSFNILDWACGYSVLMDEVTDELARTIHSAYVNTQMPFVTWKELNEDMKDANRWQADHLSIKLRAIGCDGDDLSPLDKAERNPEVFERLSEMEHRRWMAERLMDGWRYGTERDNSRKIHNLIVPYEQLSDAEKNKDKDMVQNIRNLVKSEGWKKQKEFLQSTSFSRYE